MSDPTSYPKKFTRAQIEWRVDELALQFQGTKDKKILAQIAALNRVLAKMDALGPGSSRPKNQCYLLCLVIQARPRMRPHFFIVKRVMPVITFSFCTRNLIPFVLRFSPDEDNLRGTKLFADAVFGFFGRRFFA
jgi:hypothetical protein